MIYKNVADGISDISEASNSIISTMKAFGIEADNAMSIADKFNAIGNNFAISSAGLGEAMQRSASALAAAGNTIDQSAALITAANTTVQDESQVGAAMKTISLRIRGMTTELEAAGETTEGMAESTSKLRDKILALSGVDIMIDENNFKSTYQILDELSDKWSKLEETERASLTELIAGKNRANVFESLMGNFETAREALSVSLNAEGSAAAELAKYTDSIQGHINVLKTSFEELSANFISSDLVKFFVDAATGALNLVNGIVEVTNSLGGLKTVLFAVAGFKFAANLKSIGETLDSVGGRVFKFIDDLEALPDIIKESKASGEGLSGVLGAVGISATGAQIAIAAFVAVLTIAIAAYSNWRQKVEQQRQEAIDAANASADEAKNIMNLYSAYKEADAAYDSNTGSKEALEAATSELLQALGVEEDKIAELVGTYGDLDTAINSVTSDALQKAVSDAVSGFNAAKDELEDDIGNGGDLWSKVKKYFGFGDGSEILSWNQELESVNAKIKSTLTELGIMGESDFGTTGGIMILDTDSVDGLIASYDKLVQARDALQKALTTEEYTDSHAVDMIEGKIADLQPIVQQYLDARQLLNESQAKLLLFNEFTDNGIPETVSDVVELRNELVEAAIASGDFAGSADDIGAAFDAAIGEFSYMGPAIAEAKEQLTEAARAADDFHNRLTMEQPEIAGGNRLQHYAEKLKELGLTDVDLQSFVLNPGSTADGASQFRALAAAAAEYGISVEALIPLLIKWGYVQGQVTSTTDKTNGVLHQSYEALSAAATNAVTAQQAASDVFADNTYLTEDSYNAIVELVGAESELSDCVDTTNGYLVTNAATLQKIVGISSQATLKNVRLASSHEKLNYHKLTSQLRDVVAGMTEYDSATMSTVKTILSQLDATDLQIAKYAMLEQQLLGATNAFTKFAEAQEIDAAADYTDDLSSMITSLIGSFENHEFGTETFWTTFKSLIPDDVYGSFEDIGDQIDAGWDYLNTKLSRYFTYDGGNVSIDFDNVKAFVEDGLATAFAEGENVFVGTLDSFELNPQITSIEQLADAMGVTTTAAFALGNAISKYSADNADFLSSLSIDSLEGKIYAADQGLVELLAHKAQLMETGSVGTDDWYATVAAISEANAALDELAANAREEIHKNITIDSNILAQQQLVDNLYTTLSSMDEADVNYSATFDDYIAATEVLAGMLEEKYALEEPTELTVEVAVEQIQSQIDSVKTTLSALATFDGTTYTANVAANQSEVDELVEKLNSLEGEKAEIEVYAGIDTEDVMSSLETIENFTVKDKEFSVTANTTDAINDLKAVQEEIAAVKSKTVYVNTVYTSSGSSSGTTSSGSSSKKETALPSRAYGTARYTGDAYEQGTWGTRHPEKNALVGELGEELWVDPNTGTYQTVGENGAEFINLPRGAIVFNHKQTEGLLKNKRINSRGIAYVSGNAHYTMLDGHYSFGGSSGGGGSSSGSSSSGSGSSSSSDDKKTWFDEAYAYHQHMLAMDQESLEDYLNWLQNAYQQAYDEGIIELEDMYKYEEECYEKRKELFDDFLNDLEFKIEGLGRQEGTANQIINIYLDAIANIDRQIAEARARGLNDDDDYIQELLQKRWGYEDEIADMRDDATKNAKNAAEEIIEYRIKMLKQDLKNEKEALNDKKSALKDFYDEQKQMLQDEYDAEKTMEEREEKRKKKSDIEAELAQLEFDDSAWAQKRKKELQADLADANKELDDFEKEQALDSATDLIDKQYEQQAALIDKEIEAIDAKLNDPKALYNQALNDIKNNSEALFAEMVEYNDKYGLVTWPVRKVICVI